MSSFDDVLTDVKTIYDLVPVTQSPVINIPEYYKDREGNVAAKTPLELQTSAALAYALVARENNDSSAAQKAYNFISAYTDYNTSITGSESQLYLCYKGQRLLEAAKHLKAANMPVPASLAGWITNVYVPNSFKLQSHKNNWGMWSIATRIMVEDLCSSPSINTSSEALKHIANASRPFLGLNRDGELWTENLRNNYWVSYTYFYLSPALKVGIICPAVLITLIPLINRFYQTVSTQDFPQRFPYTRLANPFGWIQKQLWPSNDEFDEPTKSNWAGSLLKVAGHVCKVSEWSEWAKDNTERGVNLFRYADFLIERGWL